MTPWSESDSERASTAEQPAFLLFAVFLLLQVTAAAFLQVASVPFGLVFSEVFFFAAPVVLWLLATNHRPLRFLKLGKAPGRLIALAIALGAANFLLAGAIQALCRGLLPSVAKTADPLRLFRDASAPELAAVVVAVGVFAPLCEEIAFRGYLQTVLGARYGRRAGVALAAILFSLLHLDPAGLLARVELGVLFGLLALWSGSIWPAIAAHAANNLIASSLMIAALGEPPPTGAANLGEALLYGALSLVATAALLLAYRKLARARSPSASDDQSAQTAVEASHAFVPARALRAALVTFGVAAVALLVFFAASWRTAMLNLADAFVPAARIEERLADASLRDPLRRRLKDVRALARQGEVELERYSQLRKSLLTAGGKGPKGLDAEAIEAAFSGLEAGR
ncbi:MAG: CPBP family intramembrane glutamic endopeptidase [Myxococcales bacterium]